MATEEKIIERITMLLRKAESTTPEEAQACREHAERLMMRHSIDQARIHAEQTGYVNTESIISKQYKFKGSYFSRVQISFWNSVLNGFGELRGFQWTLDRSTRVYSVYGHESDVAKFDLLITSLWLQAQSEMKRWYKLEGQQEAENLKWHGVAGAHDKLRGDFLINFAQAVRSRLITRRTEALNEVKGTGTDLVLVSRQSRVDEESGWNQARPARGHTNFRANRAGRLAGERAGLGDNEIGQQGAITSK